MVIDFHVHCFPDEIAQNAVKVLSQNAGIPAMVGATIGEIKRSMMNAGIDASVVLSIATKPSQTKKINDWSRAINIDNIIAFGSVHPEYEDWKDELDRIKEFGLKGIKFHPEYQEFYVDDKKMYPIYEYAIKLGLVIVFHAGVDLGMPTPYHCNPERLMKLTEDFKGGKIVAAHMGSFQYWDDVERYLIGKDIYFDTSFSLGIMSDEQAKRIIMNHGYEKILFATDSPWTSQEDQIEKIKRLGLGKEVEEAILGLNAKKLLGIR